MDHEALSRIVFEESHVVSADQDARSLFRGLPQGGGHADRLIGAMATFQLVAVLESVCLREVHRYVESDEETVVGRSIECRHCAPIPRGAKLRISGWVEGIGERDVTVRIQAFDDCERVCDGTICLVVVRRGEIARRIERKCEAIARRELFLSA